MSAPASGDRVGTDTAAARFLTLVRHAQAEPASGGGPDADHERALTARGRRDAEALAASLATAVEGVAPIDRVLSSDATRTRQTLALLAPALGPAGGGAAFERALYLASADALAERVGTALADGSRHVLLVGHNPGIELLGARLAGAPGLAMGTCARLTLRLGDGAPAPGGATIAARG